METTTCAIAGGGPAGMMLGLLLARAGVEVVILEKHGDFLRDFRGDTVHPSTLEILDELGLGKRFAELPQFKATKVSLVTDEGEATVGDLSLLRGPHPYIAFVPQWDFLDLIADEARRYPNFTLKMNCEALTFTGKGLRYRDKSGAEEELRAVLTVAADGRGSVLRSGLPLRDYGAPMDVGWFRLPRRHDDPPEPFLRVSSGRLMVAIKRETHWQLGYIVPKGQPVSEPAALRPKVGELIPFLADRLEELNDVRKLTVQVNRLERWYRPGLLCIGDAAHAMSPVFGVGINLAIQDAVAAANLLWRPLREGAITRKDLAAVQKRRTPATVLTQRMQVFVQKRFIAPSLGGRPPKVPGVPGYLRVAVRPFQRVVTALIVKGFRPEHVRAPAVWTEDLDRP